MTVEQDSLGDDDLFTGDPKFAVNFTDGGNDLKLYVYDNDTLSTHVTVVLYDGGTKVSECGIPANTTDRVTIDVSAATLDGGTCEPLVNLSNRLPAEYTIRFENSTKVEGNYSLIVNRTTDNLETGADDTAAEPYAAPAIYSAELSVTYQSSVIYYRTNVTIAPEEFDA